MRRIVPIFALLFTSITAFAGGTVKEADLAGSWYPKSGVELSALLRGFLNTANPPKVDGRVFAIISPHAGYRFSGLIAAYGFKAVQRQPVNTVVIIGFSHRKFFDGISIYDRGAWATPLGEARIDESLARELISTNPRIRFEPGIFKEENSVEMQVPFVQTVFKNAKIVPLAFGAQEYGDAEILAHSLAKVLRDRDDALVIASTDLSHYHAYEEAKMIDSHLINMLNAMNSKGLYEEAKLGICELCGIMPVAASILAAQELGFGGMKILKYANSGDTSGDKDNVVGYLSAVIYKETKERIAHNVERVEKKEASGPTGRRPGGASKMLSEIQKKELLRIARESIASFVKDRKRKSFEEMDPLLNEPFGAFVTLHEAGELRGCIGNMVGHGPLYQTVADMAIEAATGDPRFPSLTAKELDMIDIEISVLTPLQKVQSYDDVRIPGHGVLIKRGFKSGVYLPQVATETGWGREEFLTSLCAHKAGLAPDAWKDPATDIYVFSAEVFGEKEG